MPLYTEVIDGSCGYHTSKAVQKFLVSKGFNPGPEDGHFGDMTARAFQQFLAARGFNPGPIDGKMRDGHQGWSMKACQKWLKSEGYDPGPIDGRWGCLTCSALQRFLQAHTTISHMNMNLVQRLALAGGASGNAKYTIKLHKGHTAEGSINSEVWMKVSASAEGAFKVFSASVSTETGFKLSQMNSWSNESRYTEEVEITVDMSKPCYIYQLESSFDMDGKSVTVGSMGFTQTTEPIVL